MELEVMIIIYVRNTYWSLCRTILRFRKYTKIFDDIDWKKDVFP